MLLRNQASNPQAVAVYDNINFADRKRHEEVGHTAVFHSFTNAAWVVCDELPEDGLFQEMHDSSVPLKLEDIALSRGIQGGDSFARDVSTYFIAEAIERLHHDAVANNVFKQCRDRFPSFPVEHQLPPRKTQFWQFAGIAADEGIIEGTYQVHVSIFLHQLRLERDDKTGKPSDFPRLLFLAYGDQLTAARIRAVRNERRHAQMDYD